MVTRAALHGWFKCNSAETSFTNKYCIRFLLLKSSRWEFMFTYIPTNKFFTLSLRWWRCCYDNALPCSWVFFSADRYLFFRETVLFILMFFFQYQEKPRSKFPYTYSLWVCRSPFFDSKWISGSSCIERFISFALI